MELGLIESKLCDVQGSLFESFVDTNYDPESLVKIFMTSKLGENLDSDYNRMQWAGEEYLLEELLDVYKDKLEPKTIEYSKDALFWMGYTYRYWHYYKNESSKNIYKIAPFKTMNINYFMFHTFSVEYAIDDLIEIHRQKKKKDKGRIGAKWTVEEE